MHAHERADAEEACRRAQEIVTWICTRPQECQMTLINGAVGSIMLTAYWSQPDVVRDKWLNELMTAVRNPEFRDRMKRS